jgi:hypothetical protein
MMRDPHEQHRRLPEFRGDDGDEQLFAALNHVLAAAELPPPSMPADAAEVLPVIYVIGAPRSGTTLLSQLLSRYLEVGYIDNLIARFWMRPSAGIRLSETVLGRDRRQRIAFTSRHGVTQDAAGPHEFGYFWRRWLNLDHALTHHLGADDLTRLDLAGLRRELRVEILASFGRPTVFKNVICGFQAEWLTRVHPRSLFVHVKRSVGPTARSILKSRMERYGSYDAWWSLKPSTFDDLQQISDPAAQVVGQITACRREFEHELSRSGVTALTVDYDEMCRNPGSVLRNVCELARQMGHAIEALEPDPPGFSPSPGPALPPDLEQRLGAAATS